MINNPESTSSSSDSTPEKEKQGLSPDEVFGKQKSLSPDEVFNGNQDTNDELKTFYQDIKKAGAITNLPAYDEFKNTLSDPSNRRVFYDEVKSSGLISNLPDYDTFNQRLFTDEPTINKPDETKLRTFYDRLKKSNSVSGLPEYDKFRSNLIGNTKFRREFYNKLRSNGDVSGLPDYDTFNNTLFGESGELEIIPETEPEPSDEKERNPFISMAKTFWNVASKQIPASLEFMKAATLDRSQPMMIRGQVARPALSPEEESEQRNQAFRNAAKRMEEFRAAQENQVTTTGDINDSIDMVNYVGNSVAQAAAQIPASLITGGATSIGQEIGIIYMDQVNKIAEDKGITPEEVIERGLDDKASAIGYGMMAGALDYLGAKGASKAAPFNQFKKDLRRRALALFGAAGKEGLTEGSQSIIEQFGASRGANESLFKSIAGVDLREVGEEALAGLIGGAGINVSVQAVEGARGKRIKSNVKKKAQKLGFNDKEAEAIANNAIEHIKSRNADNETESETGQHTLSIIDEYGNIDRNGIDNPFVGGPLDPNLNESFPIVDNVDAANSTSSLANQARENGTKGINIKSAKQQAEGSGFESVSPEVAKRKEEAFGARKQGVFKQFWKGLSEVKKSFTQKYTKLDKVGDAVGIDILRQFEATDNYAKVSAYNSITNIVSDLGNSEYKTFIDALILPDIIRDHEAGLYEENSLPFGYESIEQVQQDLESINQKVANNPNLQRAIDKRTAFVNDLKQRMVDYGLLPKTVLQDDRYFHRQVLKFLNNQDYIGTGLATRDVRRREAGFQKGRKGGGDFNTAYHESEMEWVSQALKQIVTVETLNRLNTVYNVRERLEEEAAVLSEEQGREVTWRELIPKDHVIWRPEKGNYFYKANHIDDRIVSEVLSGQREFKKDDVRRVIAIGTNNNQWVIPKRVADTLNNLRDEPESGPLGKIARNINTSWKQYILINPMRIIKYNLNNTSGDLDIALAYDPAITKGMFQAAKDLYKSHKGKTDLDTQKELEELIRLGVIDSGLTMEEIPDISKEGIFKSLTGNNRKNIIGKFWKSSKAYTTIRENVLRLAAYRRFLERIQNGETGIYGASDPQQVAQITAPKDKAAKLARELVGDYGNLSKNGQWLRKNMIPFYSWMEINAPRYYRLLKNLPYEAGISKNRLAAMGVKKLAFGSAKLAGKGGILALKANILFTMIHLWNKAFFPDEEEELIGQRNQLQLILGRRDDGTIISLRFQGALSDALGWFGLENAPGVMEDVAKGTKSMADVIENAIKAPANRIFNASVPIPKTVTESLLGASAYPDVFNPRTVRDPGEHASRLLSLDWLYNYVTNKPTPPGNPIGKLFLYRTNPDEAAYYHTKRMVIDYLKEQGREFPRIQPTERSNALYYYKQAAKWGEQDKAKFWYKKYLELGGKPSGVKQSVRASAPLSGIKKSERAKFLQTLSEEEREIVKRGRNWYNHVYQ